MSDWPQLLSVGGRKATKGGRGGGRDGGKKGVHEETKNLVLKKALDEYSPLKIKFEWNDQGTMLQIGPNAVWWSNLVDKLVREFLLYYLSWSAIEKSKKAHIIVRLMKGIEQHFAKLYSDNKCTLKRLYWNVRPDETRDVEMIRARPPSNGSRLLVVLRDQQMESSESHEYPSLISSFYDTYTHDGVWVHKEAQLQYEEMIKPRDLKADTPTRVPYTKKKILAMVRKGKQRRHIPGVGRQVARKGKTSIFSCQPRGTYTDVEIDDMLTTRDKLGSESEVGEGSRARDGSGSGKGGDDQLGRDEDVDGDDDEGSGFGRLLLKKFPENFWKTAVVQQ
ncbi:hypothetical protein Tco_1556113 [Tanacetum coccineum]